MPTFDSSNLTALSESSPRSKSIDTLQIHHTTTTSFSGARALMDPGGRQVSANGLMSNTGELQEVVATNRRAFTSASAYDHRSFTVEVCNTSLAPNWGISQACHDRLAVLAVELHHEFGMPLDRQHIIGHNETPGSYATACPGPSMNLDYIVAKAIALITPVPPTGKETDMELRVIRVGGPDHAPILKFMVYGPSGIDAEIGAKGWAALSPARPPITSAMHMTQANYDLELAYVRQTAAVAGAPTSAQLAAMVKQIIEALPTTIEGKLT